MDNYAIYLRKSRIDREAELRGEEETLARHERVLLDLSKKQNLNVVNIYREVVSGETISARPVMQQLLADIETGIYSGILVMEVERLARGDTIDQGIVSQSFKLSETKIITPIKTYDPNNEFDEEYFEFGLFMSRREYKTITRRLQNGRLASVKEGKYVGNIPPYGYERIKIKGDKGFTLKIVPEESEVVQMIYHWYTCEDRIGMSRICRCLNDMAITPRNNDVWTTSTIKDILTNPVYYGYIRWNGRKAVKSVVNGEVVVSRPRAKNEDITLAKGLHDPIIDRETWEKAQHFRTKNRRHSSSGVLTNPLAGLVFCGKCGRRMSRRLFQHNKQQHLLCNVTACNNVSVQFDYVEEAMLKGLNDILNNFTVKLKKQELKRQSSHEKKIIATMTKELEKLNAQKNKLHDLLEQGIYTTEMFLERARMLGEKSEKLESEIRKAKKMIESQLTEQKIRDFIPKIQNAIQLYGSLEDAEMKNKLLKTVISKMVYTKEKGGRWHCDPKDFILDIHTLL